MRKVSKKVSKEAVKTVVLMDVTMVEKKDSTDSP